MTYRGRLTYSVELDPTVFNEFNEPVGRTDANVVGSLRPDGLHAPVLDIDFDADLLESSTPGHYHLYLNGVTLTWERYEKLLNALAEAGIISENYRKHSVRQRQTAVRLPWVHKSADEASSDTVEWPEYVF